MSRVVCIVVNHRRGPDTVATLRSLAAVRERCDVDVVLLDNASTERTVAEISAGHDVPFTLMRSTRNLGFAGACNLAMERALADGCEYVWLLNNDAVVEPDSLTALLEAAEQLDAAVVGSLVRYDPARETVWYAGGRVLRPWYVVQHLHKGRRLPRSRPPGAAHETGFVCACSTLIRRDALEQVGLFDPDLFLYGEDLDFCLRARRAGFRLAVAPASVVYHKVSQSTGGEWSLRREYYLTRNGLTLIGREVRSTPLRWLASSTRALWHALRFARSGFRSGVPLVQAWRAYRRALSDGRAGRLGPAPL
jgi:GT2 family glycosyltransferase